MVLLESLVFKIYAWWWAIRLQSCNCLWRAILDDARSHWNFFRQRDAKMIDRCLRKRFPIEIFFEKKSSFYNLVGFGNLYFFLQMKPVFDENLLQLKSIAKKQKKLRLKSKNDNTAIKVLLFGNLNLSSIFSWLHMNLKIILKLKKLSSFTLMEGDKLKVWENWEIEFLKMSKFWSFSGSFGL